MKSTIRKNTYKAIYRLLDRVTPLQTDCGLLCDAACCKSTEADMGIYLFPGEEKLFTRKEDWLKWESEHAEDYDFPDSWHGRIYFVRCTSAPNCPREKRPLQCRFFPLAPHLTKDGHLILIHFVSDLPYSCPLISNKTDLDPAFVQAVYTVWKRLIQDPLIYDLIQYDSVTRNDAAMTVIYPSNQTP
jgi:hypothetical protein